MTTFAGPDTRSDAEDWWAAETLGKAQRAGRELRTMIDWRTASDKRPSLEEVQRHGEEVKDNARPDGRRIIPSFSLRLWAIAGCR